MTSYTHQDDGYQTRPDPDPDNDTKLLRKSSIQLAWQPIGSFPGSSNVIYFTLGQCSVFHHCPQLPAALPSYLAHSGLPSTGILICLVRKLENEKGQALSDKVSALSDSAGISQICCPGLTSGQNHWFHHHSGLENLCYFSYRFKCMYLCVSLCCILSTFVLLGAKWKRCLKQLF